MLRIGAYAESVDLVKRANTQLGEQNHTFVKLASCDVSHAALVLTGRMVQEDEFIRIVSLCDKSNNSLDMQVVFQYLVDSDFVCQRIVIAILGYEIMGSFADGCILSIKTSWDIELVGSQVLMYAVKNRLIGLLRVLIFDGRMDLNQPYEPIRPDIELPNTAIQAACILGYTEIVKVLLDAPQLNLAENRNLVLTMAASYGRADVVALLLADLRVDPSASQNAALWVARNWNHTEIVEMLMRDPRVTALLD